MEHKYQGQKFHPESPSHYRKWPTHDGSNRLNAYITYAPATCTRLSLHPAHSGELSTTITLGLLQGCSSSIVLAIGGKTTVLAKHSKSFSLIDCISMGITTYYAIS